MSGSEQRGVCNWENSRRKFVKMAGTIGVVGTIAGCLGAEETAEDPDDEAEEPADEEYPTQEIDMVIPFEAGGGTDTQYRGIQDAFEEELGVGTIPDNRPGASGRTGMNHLMGEEGDGYTYGCISTLTACLGQVMFDTDYNMEELEKVGASTALHTAIIAEQGRFDGVADFAEWARNADEISHGSVGVGASTDFIGKAQVEAIGVDMENISTVPYEADPEIGAAAARGEIDFGSLGELGAESLREEGDIDVLWVVRPDQSAAHPDAPTLDEAAEAAGVDELPFFSFELGFFGPPGIPEDRIEHVEQAIVNLPDHEEVQAFAEDQGLTLLGWDSQEHTEQVEIYLEEGEGYAEIFGDE